MGCCELHRKRLLLEDISGENASLAPCLTTLLTATHEPTSRKLKLGPDPDPQHVALGLKAYHEPEPKPTHPLPLARNLQPKP